jgi:hypothetical protein
LNFSVILTYSVVRSHSTIFLTILFNVLSPGSPAQIVQMMPNTVFSNGHG